MCGIFGVFNRKGTDSRSLKTCTDTLLHRGPDAGGYYENDAGNVFLGHRRLSIVDLSTAANQPMYSHNQRYVMVYNGEVYNTSTLKDKLPGFPWRTSGDTEVILELFAQFGTTAFQWLNGIFAIVIYDRELHKMYVCRDQLGIKPLFVAWQEDSFYFASELKAIKKALPYTTSVRKEAVSSFLHLGYIPEPYTIYQEIEKFPAAHFASYDLHSGTWSQERYWNAEDYYLSNPVNNEAAAIKAYKETLFAAVDRQMMSDVPLGTFLSGGIDSSMVSAVASKISPNKISTFSIGFTEASFDESQYANAVAQHLGTQHHLFKVKLDDVLQLVPDFIDVYDEPFADSSAFPTMLVSKLAREHVTVTLSGDGGDEFFQGYGMYAWAKRLNNPLVKLLRKPAYAASKMMSMRFQRAGQVFNYPDVQSIPSHIFSQEQYFFSEQELSTLLQDNPFDFSVLNRLPEGGTAQEKQAFWDIDHYLKDDLLVKVDRASMRYSLETRVPLLDKEIVELALNIPLQYKINPEYGTKYLMKKVLYEMVPRDIFERPKRGFAIPLKQWLGKELKGLVTQYLNEQTVTEAAFVNWKPVQQLLQDFYAGKTYLYNRVWVLLVLHWWYRKNI